MNLKIKGFTIIEVLIATGIFSVIVCAVLFQSIQQNRIKAGLDFNQEFFSGIQLPVDQLRKDIKLANNISNLAFLSPNFLKGIRLNYQFLNKVSNTVDNSTVDYRLFGNDICFVNGLPINCLRLERVDQRMPTQIFNYRFILGFDWCIENNPAIGVCPNVGRINTTHTNKRLIAEISFLSPAYTGRLGLTEQISNNLAVEIQRATIRFPFIVDLENVPMTVGGAKKIIVLRPI